MKEKIALKKDIDWNKISLLMKIGLLGALINLAGDMIIGWGIRNEYLIGIEGFISHYLKVSDIRLFWSAILGLIGAPVSTIAHFGVYQLIKQFSQKYSKLYRNGLFGCLILGGPGVHMSSVATAFFYKYMTVVSPNTALAASIKFACYFSLPLYIPFFAFLITETYAHLKVISTGLSPYPRWCWIFSLPVGTLIFSFIKLLGNHAIVNAIMVGSLTLGNIWTIAGLLMMLKKAEENWQKVSV